MRRSTPAILAASLGAITLAACGSSPASTNPSTLLSGAANTLKTASSVHMKGTVTSSGQTVSIDADIVGSDFSGDITMGNASFHIVYTGSTFYISNAATFWQANAPTVAALIPDSGNGCVSFSTSTPGIGQAVTGFSQLTNLGTIAGGIPTTGLTLGSSTTVNGVSGTTISDSSGNSAVVSNDSPPQLLEIKSGTQGSIDFTKYGSAGPITAPSSCPSFASVAGASAPTS